MGNKSPRFCYFFVSFVFLFGFKLPLGNFIGVVLRVV